jgi:hypothetical protein
MGLGTHACSLTDLHGDHWTSFLDPYRPYDKIWHLGKRRHPLEIEYHFMLYHYSDLISCAQGSEKYPLKRRRRKYFRSRYAISGALMICLKMSSVDCMCPFTTVDHYMTLSLEMLPIHPFRVNKTIYPVWSDLSLHWTLHYFHSTGKQTTWILSLSSYLTLLPGHSPSDTQQEINLWY